VRCARPPTPRKRRHLRHAAGERRVDLQQAAFTSYQIFSLTVDQQAAIIRAIS
jgi:hypothetical protein